MVWMPNTLQIIFCYSMCRLFLRQRGRWHWTVTNADYRDDFSHIFLPVLERVENILRAQLEAAIAERKEVKASDLPDLVSFVHFNS